MSRCITGKHTNAIQETKRFRVGVYSPARVRFNHMKFTPISRRELLQGTFTAGGIAGIMASSPLIALAQTKESSTKSALALPLILNRTKFGDLPPATVKHAKMIIASPLASAASGSLIGSARLVPGLVKEEGGEAEAR